MLGWLRLDPDHERGASLISALLLVAVMTSIAMVLMTELRFSMRRSANLEVRDQAYWYALGARELAESMVDRAMQNPELALRPDAEWLTGARRYPILDGELVGAVRDGNNCFNLNSIVRLDEQNERVTDPVGRQRFERLMTEIGIPGNQAARIAAQLTDWVDSDLRASVSGGEDELYADSRAPHRTGNTLLAEVEELLALEAVTPPIYQTLRPFVCVRPFSDPMPLNLNTLGRDQLPLLVAILGGETTLSDVDGILIARPSEGFANAEAFWLQETVTALGLTDPPRDMIGMTTNYFEIEIDVLYAGTRFELDETIEWLGGGSVRRLSQRYGSFS